MIDLLKKWKRSFGLEEVDPVVGIGGSGCLVVGGRLENVELRRGDKVVLCVLISPVSGIFENGTGRSLLRFCGGSVVLSRDGFKLFNICSNLG